MSCVFCDICKEDAPAKVVYQDERISCFLPIDMEVYGHLLIVPNKHYENLFEIPEEDLSYIIKFAKKISMHLKEKLGATGVNILHASGKSAQQSVFHFHIHVFPRFDNDGLDTWPKLEKKNFDQQDILNKIKL